MTRQRCTAFAPGRVNLIGEHTDYNDGLSLPFAIGAGVTVTATRLAGDAVEAIALDLGEQDRFAVGAPPPADGWRAFVRGTVGELRAAGRDVPAARLEIRSDLPTGSGLSSSAALTVALCLALLGLAGEEDADRVALAQLCSKVEHDRVGARTGLLDQLASLLGRPGQAVRIDFRTLETRPVALALDGWTLVAADSGETHSHAESGYNERRRECELARERLGVASLRDAAVDAPAELPEPLGRRVRHVIEENARVDAVVAALEHGDLDEVGVHLRASHASLRDLYEASTPAVEAAVARLEEHGAAGARMMGGGFGGYVLGLLPPGCQPPPEAIVVAPREGARLLSSR